MTESYPIVSEHQLQEPFRRGRFSLTKRRDSRDIPPVKAHQFLVYRVGASYVVDDGSMGLDSDYVVNATSVSIVSVRRDTEVGAVFSIASEDAAEFRVRVNFVCSVLDPVTVVRDGQTNVGDTLLAYLESYQDLFEVGLKHPIEDINAVRSKLGAHVKAYVSLKPPQIPGMQVRLGNIHVDTPQALAKFQDERRGKLQEERLKDEQEAAERRRRREQQEHEQALAEDQQDHHARLTRNVGELVGDDPLVALNLALAEGDISRAEYVEKVHQLEQERHEREGGAAELERHAQEKAAEVDREDRLVSEARAREDRLTAEANARADKLAADERAQEARERSEVRRLELKKLQLENKRDKRNHNAEQAHALRKQTIETNVELLRIFAARGLLDNYYVNIGEIVSNVLGADPAVPSGEAVLEGSGKPALERSAAQPQPDAAETVDLKEEDGS